jgi:diaminohydroxyphosphoribosylaminopyrimidine deaminase / 5-amino-6-(5-phosphoribosylamino)uracil reductase
VSQREFSEFDKRMMARAIELGKNGWPAPNPRVGCILTKGEEIVAEGWHEYAGAPHAEAMALNLAKERAEGSTAYVSLEPCSHFGRTPPCANALIEARVRRVVYAIKDPNPLGAGGDQVLQSAGIEVQEGLLLKESAWMNHVWLFQALSGRPFVTLKAAVTHDGFMARLDGTSKWITSEEARLEGHRLRTEMGSVLVGRGTVAADDPSLTARFEGVVNQPRPIVLDPQGRLTGGETVLQREGALWIQAEKRDDPRVRQVDIDANGFDLAALLAILKKEGISGVLVEGGPAALAAFAGAGLWDRLDIFIAPHSFEAGIPLPSALWDLARNLEATPGILRSESQAGPDRHITLWREAQIMGTIMDRLGSQPL